MTSNEFPLGNSRVVAGLYPPPGTDPHADAIRERRGARGITPLDANLLHTPAIAGGFNALLGAVRTKGKLPGDIREVMILRVAAINHAAFEWIHHEIVGRKEGLTTGQLYAIRDVDTPLPPLSTILTPLQAAAIAFTDHSTRGVKVPMMVIEELKKQIQGISKSDEEVEDLYVEAAMVVASYNMVSRFLLATDVAGLSDMEVPWPVDRKEHFISLPSFPPASAATHTVHAITLITSPSAPWIVFANSLLTDWTMWNYIVPYLLDLRSTSTDTYNILLHSQRGHGLSTLPSSTLPNTRQTTIPLLAHDIANLIETLNIPTPVHAVIGVSQGGAAALAFASLYGTRTKHIVTCDTAPRTPPGNKEAWEDRIQLVHGSELGMGKLADVTVPRWFPPGSFLSSENRSPAGQARARWVGAMVQRTSVEGFVHGARALGNYDLIVEEKLFTSNVGNVTLLAGALDGGGKVAQGLRNLQAEWTTAVGGASVPAFSYVEIAGAGHLPIIDSPDEFCSALHRILSKY